MRARVAGVREGGWPQVHLGHPLANFDPDPYGSAQAALIVRSDDKNHRHTGLDRNQVGQIDLVVGKDHDSRQGAQLGAARDPVLTTDDKAVIGQYQDPSGHPVQR